MENQWGKRTRYLVPKPVGNKQTKENKKWGDQLPSLALKIIKSPWTNQERTIKIWNISLPCSF